MYKETEYLSHLGKIQREKEGNMIRLLTMKVMIFDRFATPMHLCPLIRLGNEDLSEGTLTQNTWHLCSDE